MAQDKIILSPDAMGYKDRGKMKWMGMMLSDHTEALKRLNKAQLSEEILPKEKQSTTHISHCLFHSFSQKKPLSIQLDIIKDGQYLPDIEGVIIGVKDQNVFIEERKHSIQSIGLDSIRHIQWIHPATWYEKYEARSNK